MFGVGEVKVGAHNRKGSTINWVNHLRFSCSFSIVDDVTTCPIFFLLIFLDRVGGVIEIVFVEVEFEDGGLFLMKEVRWSVDDIIPDTESILWWSHVVDNHCYCYDVISIGDGLFEVDD